MVRRMKAVIVGCGRVGASIARQLAGEGWDVTAVDDDETA
ncbi:MAG: FAD-dependent oxidoreductase, partial [Gaiella sp.]